MELRKGASTTVAKQKRKPAQSKPITSHQLFPAVVALWFGALFGLGSLAVRPSLIENLVLSSRLDLVLPAAAPPLGITARIMIAMVLAAIGATFGAMLARRLARPKVVVKERQRSGKAKVSVSSMSQGNSYGEAAACKPISINEELGDAITDPAPGQLANRRRALAIEHEEEEFVPHDHAPLPGGIPQILPAGSLPVAPAANPLAAPAPQSQPLVPPSWSEAAQAAPAPFGAPGQDPAAEPVQAQPQVQAQVFQPAADPAQAPFAAQLPAESAAAHADGRQVFGLAQPPAAPEQPRQIFGAAIEGDHVAQEFVKEAGFKTTVFETEQPSPLFVREAAPAEVVPQPVPPQFQAEPAAPLAAPIPQAFEPAPQPNPFQQQPESTAPVVAPIPQAFEPVAQQPFVPAAVEPAIAVQVPEVAAPAAVPPADQPEPLPSPASLGMTDLASRLAESMRRRRAARAGAEIADPVPAVEAAPVMPTQPEEAFQAAPQPFAEAPLTPAVPQQFVPEQFAPQLQPAATLSEQPFAPVAQEAAAAPAIPVAYEAPAPAAPAFEAPPAFAPEPIPTPAADAQAVPAAFAAASAPAAPAIPSALRPLALDAFLEEDAAIDPGLLPPRHIAMPAAPAPVQPEVAQAQPAIPVAFEPPALELGAEDEIGEEDVREDNYGSLLGIGQQRVGFVRIDEPEADQSAPEPVVIFPGQAPLAQPAPQPAAFAPLGDPEASQFRRFDGPDAIGHGQQVAAGNGVPAVDTDAADQALRAALANLQRMSGAA